jgi:hypothetical protein
MSRYVLKNELNEGTGRFVGVKVKETVKSWKLQSYSKPDGDLVARASACGILSLPGPNPAG